MNGETTIRYWPRAISCLDAGWKQLEGYIHSFIQRIRGGKAGLHLAARTNYLGGSRASGHGKILSIIQSRLSIIEEKAGYSSFLIGIGKGLQQ